MGVGVDGELLDGEGAIGSELIAGVESADALAGAKDSFLVGRVRGFSLVPAVVFDETLQLH